MSKFYKTTMLLMLVALILAIHSEVRSEQHDKGNPEQQLLEKAARESLWKVKRAIKKEGFFSARIALNIWRSNAIDAGTFDPSQYTDLKKQLYKTSIKKNLRWFDEFVLQKNYRDAGTCLELWRMHSIDMGTFDEAKYQELKKKLK